VRIASKVLGLGDVRCLVLLTLDDLELDLVSLGQRLNHFLMALKCTKTSTAFA